MRRLAFWRDALMRGSSPFATAASVLGTLGVLTALTLLVWLRGLSPPAAVVVGLFAFLILLAEGSYRVWDATDVARATAEGRLDDLNSPQAKRTWIDDSLKQAQDFIEDMRDVGDEWWNHRYRFHATLIHWEGDVRAQITKWWGFAEARRFDAHTEKDEVDIFGGTDGFNEFRDYVERRMTRLRELRDEL